jgi:hypothetical protein
LQFLTSDDCSNAIEINSSNSILVLRPHHRAILLQAQPPLTSSIARQKKSSRRPPKLPPSRPDRNTIRHCQVWPNPPTYSAGDLAPKS